VPFEVFAQSDQLRTRAHQTSFAIGERPPQSHHVW
jgi:hypothetical protein